MFREQRHIEKLKQRQERQNHQATCYNTNHVGPCSSSTEEEIVKSLWPDVEQVQSLQVDSQLPVNAFGSAVPSFSLRYKKVVRISFSNKKLKVLTIIYFIIYNCIIYIYCLFK